MTTTPVYPDWILPTGSDTPAGPPPPAPPAPPKGPDRRILVAAALVAAGALAGGATAYALLPVHQSPASAPPAVSGGATPQTLPAQANTSTPAGVAAKIDPAVVDINTNLGYRNAAAAGTGIVLTSSGEVLTNNHVISGATSIRVTDIGNGSTYPATVVGYDKSHDIAVLQLQGASGLATATIADAAAQVGDTVVGVGNAGGTGGTPSYADGVITATGQTITASDDSDGTSEQLTGLLETNAAIVAGDSGGPLVNGNGDIVGIDTAASGGFRFSQTSQAYAIPIDTALRIARQIEGHNSSDTVHIGPTAMLGVGVQPDDGQGAGAVVANVLADGPAAAAGLAAGDTITAVAGHGVSSADDLSSVILTLAPGTPATVRYVDTSGAAQSTSVTLASGPPQ